MSTIMPPTSASAEQQPPSPPISQGPQPPQMAPPPPPKQRRLKKWHWVLIGLGAFIILGVIGQAFGGGGTSTTTTNTQQQNAPNVITQPPATNPPATNPPATQLPTATSQPLTPQQQLDQTVKGTSTFGKVTEVTWDAADGMVLITLDAADSWNNSAIAQNIKSDSYRLMRAVYSDGPKPTHWVQLTFKFDTTDAYGNVSHSVVATATLAPATAAKFNWQNLTWRTAWLAYDHTYMLPDLANG